MTLLRLEVSSSRGSYPVWIGPGASEQVGELVRSATTGGRVALISDSNVAPLHGQAVLEALRHADVDVTMHTFEAGEPSKIRRHWSRLTDEILETGMGRDGSVVALGGGVTTDLAGFVAATYMRGVPVVHVATSSLAMIDAAIGGKTGVDVRAGKNLVGAFHPPVGVIADTEHLSTLAPVPMAEGLVEALKHGAIRDAGHFEAVGAGASALLEGDRSDAAALVAASVSIKAAVVSDDEFEGGYREILNFGHTIGHAIETETSFAVGHGTAVAAGMRVEARIGEILGVTEAGTRASIEAATRPLGLPPVPALDADDVLRHVGVDKKARAGRPRYVLLERIGATATDGGFARTVPDAVVREALVAELAHPL
ncbi:MAG: 3-dehydroquinate synthase [Gemmatimonadota bacterium]